MVGRATWPRDRLDQFEARPLDHDRLREALALEWPGLARHGDVRPVGSFLGPHTEIGQQRILSIDKPLKFWRHRLRNQRSDFRPCPELDPVEAQAKRLDRDPCGPREQLGYVGVRKTTDEHRGHVPVATENHSPFGEIRKALSRELLTLLERVAGQGRTLLIATHDPLVYDHPLVNRTFDLRDGRLTGEAKR